MANPTSVRLRCQRIGCDETFTEENNPDGSCTYHQSPFFHNGIKEWSCCKQRSHDFSLFLEIPGCKTGRHTTEKPLTAPSLNAQKPTPSVFPKKITAGSCLRCQQGFFCSDHVSHNPSPNPIGINEKTVEKPKPAKKKVGINDPKICQNKSCGKTFKEKDNHETACEYHPGPANFHDRVKGWKCCEVYVNEFSEFLDIPPCTKGWHNSDC
ncbi:Cysteine and histidine-rich domain-containing protein [Zostera marina]|uniref:Cysteine and histidine-rich domain-containing protein n=1 Tax=Zostera marina TaxID=29655 RepID=A0A0K9PNS7_ZOSMR|nr:Cysteine and histidine-rich domain-containing protein [Zostera marina]